MAVLIENIRIDNIPALEVFQNGASNHLPMVVLVHGWNSRKEDMLFMAYGLAINGFFVVPIDVVGHGERMREGAWTMDALFGLVHQTTEDINRVIAHYEGDTRVDVQRVGLSGISMGGVVTYEYLTRDDKQIRAAVPMIGTPDFTSLISEDRADKIMSMLGLNLQNTMNIINPEMLRAMQPAQKMNLMDSVPLLMLNGVEDPLIDIKSVRDFYQRIKPLYSQPENVQLVEYPGVGHYTPYPMQMEALRWFQRYL
jgi:dienelactone hydrolase